MSEPGTTPEVSHLGGKEPGLLLSGPKLSFQVKVAFAFHFGNKVPESRERVEKFRVQTASSPV